MSGVAVSGSQEITRYTILLHAVRNTAVDMRSLIAEKYNVLFAIDVDEPALDRLVRRYFNEVAAFKLENKTALSPP